MTSHVTVWMVNVGGCCALRRLLYNSNLRSFSDLRPRIVSCLIRCCMTCTTAFEGVICDVTKRFLMDLRAVLGLIRAVLLSFL
jgi:hypothetical protein